jgi:hypothetical protein
MYEYSDSWTMSTTSTCIDGTKSIDSSRRVAEFGIDYTILLVL